MHVHNPHVYIYINCLVYCLNKNGLVLAIFFKAYRTYRCTNANRTINKKKKNYFF